MKKTGFKLQWLLLGSFLGEYRQQFCLAVDNDLYSRSAASVADRFRGRIAFLFWRQCCGQLYRRIAV